jgi:hypothetical protein
MIISFAWTTPALLAGAKTVTRRDWKDRTAAAAIRAFENTAWLEAWDKSPRAGGKRVAWICQTHRPVRESTEEIPIEDFDREGFGWFRAQDQIGTSPSKELLRAVEIWKGWIEEPRDLWVIRFEVVDLEPQR